MAYRDHGTTLPTFQSGIRSTAKEWNDDSVLKWSGTAEPPKVGDTINVTMNRLGAARVLGYFEDAGFLGVKVSFLEPPEWYTKQNRGNPPGHVFGAEIEV